MAKESAANETANESEAVMTLANEFKPDDGGWVQLAPYGRFRHAYGTQLFEKSDAETICNEFKSPLNILGRVMGLPWYIGHPDHKAFADKYKDTRAYGRVKELAAREDGLYGKVKFNDDGKKLLADEAFHGHSVNWMFKKVAGFIRPTALKSVGFTNEPNIPTMPLAAANEEEVKAEPGDEWSKLRPSLVEKLKLAADATGDVIVNRIAELQGVADQAAANETTVTKASEDLAAANEQIKKLTDDFAAERKERTKLILDHAITSGALPVAQRGQWEESLANEFTAELPKLQALKPRMNTQSQVGKLGERNATTLTLQSERESAVNEIMTKDKCDYATAYCAARKAKPTLFPETPKA